MWGHIVWGIANHEGYAAVSAFLEQEKSDPPALVVSSAFPAGMVCRPLPPPKDPTDREDAPDRNTYSKIKEDKKIKYVSASEYFTEADTPKEVKENPFADALVMHNTIDRATNTVLKGKLYSIEEKWPKKPDWDLYILSSLAPARVKQLVVWAFENGYGADASTGKGKIEVNGAPVSVKPKKQGNTFMALGPFVDTKKVLSNIRADIFVRSGKIGGAFASWLSPYKKPVVLYDEGAVFNCDTPIEYAGELLEKMHGTEQFNICQSGFAPVIPVEA
jgi:CRISPR-associated protein Csm4